MTQEPEPEEEHVCDKDCVCPLDGDPLNYSPRFQMHRCPNGRCKNGIGLTVVRNPTQAEHEPPEEEET